MTETAQDQTVITPSNHEKKSRFIKALKQFNVKERHFLMRYALSAGLSDNFVENLLSRLRDIGLTDLDGAKAVYWGMDYHFEWINAALLLANSDKKRYSIPDHEEYPPHNEDVDLMVVMEKADNTLLLVLIEAKGVTWFKNTQFESKVGRLKALSTSAGAKGQWLQTVMLVMSPEMSKPSLTTRQAFVNQLKAVQFWPSDAPGNSAELIWMELGGFLADLTDGEGKATALQISQCYSDGKTADDADERKNRKYTHWEVKTRQVVRQKRKEQ